ncbi:hypothetical protein [Anaerococcus obesiensis]|uniref:hypothetical protein n=1 Tax=Anaerococcus obesiensis TaxID=1287640 RepID=UPI0039940CCC
MEEKEVMRFDKKNERILRIIFKSGICEDFYKVVQIDIEENYMIISRIGFDDQLVIEVYKTENILSYRINFKNTKVVLVGDEEDGE